MRAILIALALALVACGGNSPSSPSAPLQDLAASCPAGDVGTPQTGCTLPPATCTPPQIAAGQVCTCPVPLTVSGSTCVAPCPTGDTGIYPDCIGTVLPTCAPPQVLTGGTCVVPAPTVPCPIGTTTSASITCVCPAADYDSTHDQCVVPNPVAPPTCAAPAVLNAAGTACIPPPVCTAPQVLNDAGNLCVTPPAPTTCPIGQVLIDSGCVLIPTVSVTATPRKITLQDDANDPSSCQAATCADITWTFTSSLTGDTPICTDQAGNAVYSSPVGIGPYAPASDGSKFVWSISCTDQYGAGPGAASVSIAVTAPAAPPTDMLTAAGTDPYTLTWQAYGSDTECYVYLVAQGGGPFGSPTQLTPGGTPSGMTDPTPYLSPSYGPYQFVLYCNGNAELSVTENP